VSKTREPTRLTHIDKIRLTVFTQPRAKPEIVVRDNRTVSGVAAKTPPCISRCQGCEDRYDVHSAFAAEAIQSTGDSLPIVPSPSVWGSHWHPDRRIRRPDVA